jgi:hypothetical protein
MTEPRRIPSDVPRPRPRTTGLPQWLRWTVLAIMSASVVVMTVGLAVLIVEAIDSPDYSAASGFSRIEQTGSEPTTTGPLPPALGSTPTPSQPLVVILATETPAPTSTPKPTSTPQPLCPDVVERDTYCFEPYPTQIPGPPPTPDPEPEPTPRLCAAVEGGMCWKVPDATPSAPTGPTAGTIADD